MPSTQREISLAMVNQLRLIDPSASAEIGTPERKIIDTVAESLANSQVDLVALNGALDVDAKYGSNLEKFLNLFGFGRQKSTFASGFATFGRPTAATVDIRIPAGTQIMAPASLLPGGGLEGSVDQVFVTTYDVILPAGETAVVVPIRATVAGNASNVAVGTIVTVIGAPVIGVTTVTNEAPTIGGRDEESDDELKVRFKNTIFRNLAGTEDQYLAMAVSTAFSTKANVVGPQSRYREYIQVPYVDDTLPYDVNLDGYGELGNGSAGEYTTALSTIPYAKYIYDQVPYFVSNGQVGPAQIFYRNEVDFRINTSVSSRDRGDTHRMATSIPPIGLDASNLSAAYQPNVTFTNVYTGLTEGVTAIRPGDVLLLEFSYLSSASRNDFARGVTNCVDVYVDGGNDTIGEAVIPAPRATTAFQRTNSNGKFYIDNYRRIGDPEGRPLEGNVFTPLFFQPVVELPETITVSSGDTNHTFQRDLHYWGVEDVTELAGTVRSRNGIEWNQDEPSITGDGTTGAVITALSGDTALTVDNYIYDQNIIDLQAALEGSKQVTTDVLAHRAKQRYFKFDITVMYNPGVATVDVNIQIQAEVARFFSSQIFGSTIQLSDILAVIHDVGGVDNVRWSADVDVKGGRQLYRVQECNRNGQPLVNVNVQRWRKGGSVSEVQYLYRTGNPTSGYFNLGYLGSYTEALPYNASPDNILTQLNINTTAGVASVGASGLGTAVSPWVVTFTGTAGKTLLTADPTLLTATVIGGGAQTNTPLQGAGNINYDFFLRDNELPSLPAGVSSSDTVAGFIIRPRAQSTWYRG